MQAFRQVKGLFQDRRDARAAPLDLERLQERRLSTLVMGACRRAAFWRRRFLDAGVRPEDIRSARDLERLPVLTKEDLQQTPLHELLVEGVDQSRCRHFTTSGSSGRPLAVCFSPADATRINLSWLRPLFAHGISPWDKRFEITGAHNVPTGPTRWQRLGLWRRDVVSILAPPSEWVTRLERADADYLWGYGSAIKMLAQYLHDERRSAPRMKAVFAVSDATDSSGRELVRDVFGCEIVDMYGATETGCIAWQCVPNAAYHVNADNVIVEILAGGKPAAPGEVGTVVVTNLFSTAMPLVRYELGDRAASGGTTPDCGRSTPHLARLEGREDAALRLPSGKTLAPMFFDNVLKHFLEVRAWRAVQSADLDVCLSLIPGPGYGEDVERALRERIAASLPERLVVRVEIVSDIPPDPAGKRRAVLTLATAPPASSPRR